VRAIPAVFDPSSPGDRTSGLSLLGTRRPLRPAGRKVLSVQNLSMGAAVKNNSFSVFSGQITGIFGLIGSGRTETAKVVSGVLKRDFFHGGQVRLDGKPVLAGRGAEAKAVSSKSSRVPKRRKSRSCTPRCIERRRQGAGHAKQHAKDDQIFQDRHDDR